MGLHKQYLKVGQNAKNRLFGVSPSARRGSTRLGKTTNAKPISMLISNGGNVSTGRMVIVLLGLFTLALGIILSSIPWLDYLILKHLRLSNGTLSYHYWHKPGVVRLTKVYIFNVTNPEGFLSRNEKPRLVEVGPFVYREDMEKVNVKFHDNGTVSYQHNKILRYVPDLSVGSKDEKLIVPNIPLLTLSSKVSGLSRFLQMGLSHLLRPFKMKPFVSVSPEELMFGYDETLTNLASKFYPQGKRPNSRMGLLLGRNGTLNEVSTIFTGHTTMNDFGLLNVINGRDSLPYWSSPPCNSIRGSEGSFFPPRAFTHSDIVHVYDKDLCRILPMRYRGDTVKDGITAGYYTPTDDALETAAVNPDNKCYCPNLGEFCPPKGLQNINPCHFDAPVYLSYPHFYQADSSLTDPIDGLNPRREVHESFFKIQTKLGVPLEGQIRVQLNLKVDRAAGINIVSKFPSMVFPIMWLEEGISELSPSIHKWIYLATCFAETAAPLFSYGCIAVGSLTLIVMFVRAYRTVVLPSASIERGKEMITRELRELRRGSSFMVNGHPRLLILRDSYTLLDNINGDPDPDADRSSPEL